MKESYVVVHRHKILLFLLTIKYIFFIVMIILALWFFSYYKDFLSPDVSNYIFLPLIVASINYIFLQVILDGIDFYGRIMLIGWPSIVLAHTSFLLVDDIEFIDTKSILKLDVECHWLLANIIDYWDIIIEQRNDVRRIHYLPCPHAVYDIIKQKIPARTTVKN